MMLREHHLLKDNNQFLTVDLVCCVQSQVSRHQNCYLLQQSWSYMRGTIYLFGCEFMCSMQNVPRVARSFPVHDNLCWGWLVLHSAKHFSAQVFIGSEPNDLLLFDLKQLEKHSGASKILVNMMIYIWSL